jgi:hypothetical protein
MKLTAWTAGLIIATTSAAAGQGIELGGFSGSLDYFNSRSAFNSIDTFRFAVSANYIVHENIDIDVGVAHSYQNAFGWNFGATTLSVHPRYNFANGFSAGGYLNHTFTQTPANFGNFTGFGFELLYRTGILHLAAFYGWLTGPNIADHSQNTSLGLSAELSVNPKLSLFARYQRDNFAFWGLTARQTVVGLTYDLPSFTGAEWCEPELRVGVGRLRTNGIDYDQLTFGVDFSLDKIVDNGTRRMSELNEFNSVALGLTFAF